MTLPVLKHAEPFDTLAGWDQIYYSVNWGVSPSGWNNPGANTQNVQFGRGSGATQGYALRGNTAAQFAVPITNFGMTPSASGIGIAFAYNRGGHTNASTLAEFGDIDGLTCHVKVELDTSARVVVKNGDGTILGTSDGTVGNSGTGTVAFVMPIGSGSSSTPPYCHLEIVPTINNSTGTVKIWANEVLIMNLSGKDTRNDVPHGSSTVGLINFGLAAGQTMTDFILHDASGTGQYGDKRVLYRPALADGSYTAGTIVGAATRHEAVDDIDTDGDTSYVDFDDTSLPKAVSVTVPALPANTLQVFAVLARATVRKSDAGSNIGRLLLVSGGTTDDGGVDIAVQDGYTTYTKPYILDPNGSVAWTIANANAVQPGFRRTV